MLTPAGVKALSLANIKADMERGINRVSTGKLWSIADHLVTSLL